MTETVTSRPSEGIAVRHHMSLDGDSGKDTLP